MNEKKTPLIWCPANKKLLSLLPFRPLRRSILTSAVTFPLLPLQADDTAAVPAS